MIIKQQHLTFGVEFCGVLHYTTSQLAILTILLL